MQGWSEVARETRLFETLLVFENYPTDKALAQQLSPQGASTLRIAGVRSLEQTNYPLTFVAGVGQGAGARMMLKVSYDPTRYDDATVGRMLGHLRTLLEAMPQGLDRPTAELPLLTPAERRQILGEWNDTIRPAPGADKRISDLVAEQVTRTPDAAAVAWDGADGLPRTLTYAELDRRAGRLAGELQAANVRGGSIVALYMERSAALVTALLAVVKSGGAYLPLDPGYPPERIAFMLTDSGVAVVLTQAHLRDALGAALAQAGARPQVLCVDEGPASEGGRHGERSIECPARPDDPVYVIYTSGSTGTPKGVLVPHRALTNNALVVAPQYHLAAGDRMLQLISPSFDAAGEEFWHPLTTGAAIVIPGGERERLGRPLADFCARHGVTHLHMAAPVWHQWCDDLAALGVRLSLPLKTLVVGGEAPSPERIGVWNSLLSAPCRFINAYGPTEATVTATLYATTSDASQPARLPIGKPVANVQVRVVDAQLRWLPQGAAGELLIGGAGVALGYLGRPELTAQRFVELPVDGDVTGGLKPADSDEAAAPMRFYRTGDIVRWLADGSLVFAGRADDQVKIRGYRVEPGEVEAAIAGLPGVSQVAVVGRAQDAGPAALVAYVAGGSDGLDTGALAEALAGRVPDYMLPALWVALPELPLTPTGKIDRLALLRTALPEGSAPSAAAERPMTADEELVGQLFADLLGAERVSARDSFFDLGGHSLLATRLASRIREVFGVEVPLRALFENPTVEAMARVIASARGDAPAAGAAAAGLPPMGKIERGPGGLPVEPSPLSFGQQRLWFLDQLEQGPDGARLLSYNTPAAVRLEGELDAEALRLALAAIVGRHEVLRTTFAARGGEPVQIIAPPAGLEQQIELPVEDLSHVAGAAEREQEALRRAREEARRPFDLANGPVLRARLFRLGPAEHIAIITAHHIAADGWSLGILVGELAALYADFRELNKPGFSEKPGLSAKPSLSQKPGLTTKPGLWDADLPLPPLPIQYADYAAWQRRWLGREVDGERGPSPLQAQLDYWKQQLEGLPARLDLPTDRPRPAVQSSNGSTYSFRLSTGLQKKLNGLARAEGATLYMVLLAGYQTLLSRYSGQGDIAVGSVVASRSRPELEGLIGFFVNTLVLRTRFDDSPTFRELVGRAREAALGAFAHQDVPFEMFVDAIQPRRELSHTPLFQAALSLQNLPMPVRQLPGLTLRARRDRPWHRSVRHAALLHRTGRSDQPRRTRRLVGVQYRPLRPHDHRAHGAQSRNAARGRVRRPRPASDRPARDDRRGARAGGRYLEQYGRPLPRRHDHPRPDCPVGRAHARGHRRGVCRPDGHRSHHHAR